MMRLFATVSFHAALGAFMNAPRKPLPAMSESLTETIAVPNADGP